MGKFSQIFACGAKMQLALFFGHWKRNLKKVELRDHWLGTRKYEIRVRGTSKFVGTSTRKIFWRYEVREKFFGSTRYVYEYEEKKFSGTRYEYEVRVRVRGTRYEYEYEVRVRVRAKLRMHSTGQNSMELSL